MTIEYMEIPTKCKKCGRYYIPRREQKKCPHKQIQSVDDWSGGKQ